MEGGEKTQYAAEIHAELHNGSLPEYDLEDSSFLLPTKVDRAGLSRMINEMLGLEKHVVFDILFNDEPLRTSLAEKLEEKQIKSETTIKLVYTLAVTVPDEDEVDNLNDWISGIDRTNSGGYFATTCYDGNVALYGADGPTKIMEFVTPKKSATAIALRNGSELGSNIELVCGHINGLLEAYCVDPSGSNGSHTLIARSESDNNTISTIAISANGEYLAAAGYSKDILVYDNREVIKLCNESGIKSTPRGKRKIECNLISPTTTLSKHTKAVTCIKFLDSPEGVLLSSSIDWNISIWDVISGSLLSIYNCGKAITCFDFSEEHCELFTGHEEGTVGVWELRRKGDSAQPKTSDDFSSSTLVPRVSAATFERIVTAVKVNPRNSSMVAAISLDGCAVLLDKRFIKIPLQSVTFKDHADPDRGTGCSWISSHELICCTATGAVRSLSFKELKQN
ncbi:WD40 repeat containing protein [Babesia gibsoni]|uniref:WD40 repeat containing protein n=1 Tax=Babesia gibsoni TaxID=33632 RepID=A0AAD8PGK0_BABGI|nr:WD40 repeat containing protein [Babesia gibsoni]